MKRSLILGLALLLACGDDDMAPFDGGTPDVPIPDASEAELLTLEFVPLTLEGAVPAAVTNLRFIPGTMQFLLVTKIGEFFHFDLAGDTATVIGQFMIPTDDTNDCGLIDVAFAPDFATSGHVYVARCETGEFSIVSRHVFDPDDYERFASSEELIIRVGSEEARDDLGCHNVGSIGFFEDGSLFAVFGEKRLGEAAFDPTTNLGKVVRIIPNTDGPGYTAHPENPPLASSEPADWTASGLRSPFRAVIGPRGSLWIGDVGEATTEELNVLPTPDGRNFGWPDNEGICVRGDCSAFADPIRTYNRSLEHPYILDDLEAEPTTRRAIWVGASHDASLPDQYDGLFTNRFLMGDFCAGFVRALEPSTTGDSLVIDSHAGHLTGVTASDQAMDGYHYFATYGNCFTGPYNPGGFYRAVLPSN